MQELHRIIGNRLKKIRKSRGLSLERLSELTGVSKAMLGQIERGESIPTVTTLWKIANGLKVSFSAFMEEDSHVSVVSLREITPLVEENGKYRVYPLYPYDPNKRMEIYIIEMEAGAIHQSEPHPEGVEEYIFLAKGEIEVTVNDENYTVGENSAIRLRGDRPHVYRNTGDGLARLLMMIYYPDQL